MPSAAAATAVAPPRISVFAPFAVRSFRFQWPADLAASWAVEMETLILGWYVLVETGSVLWLTLFGSLQFLGTLVAPLVGVAGDRIGHRNLLAAMRALYALLAGLLMVLALTDTLEPVYVFAIAFVAGTVKPSDLVMRNALIGEIMPADRLMGAVSVARTTADSARVAGALAGAGIAAAFGMAPAYMVIAALYATSFLLTLGIAGRGGPVRPVGDVAEVVLRVSPWRDLLDGMAYVRATPHLLAAMLLAFLINLSAFPFMNGLLPYVARDIYAIDRTGLGYLVASFASGALIGSILLARIGGAIRPARMMLAFGVVWYGLIMVFAQIETPRGGMALLFLAGFAQSLCLVPMSAMLIRSSGARFRGLVMGVRMLAVYGLPIGLLIAGPLIHRFGYATTATAYACLGITVTLLIGLRWRRFLWPLDAPANVR